jgi:hypothetical protein
MEALGALGGGAFVLVSLLVGARILLLARRTRQLPETAMGAGLVLIAGLGYPLMVLARFGEFLSDPTRLALLICYQLCQIVGIAFVSVFNWRVFRPRSRWACALVVVVCLGMVGCFVGQLLGPGPRAFMLENRGIWTLSSPLTIVPLAWGGLESLSYHLLLRRRQRLGLADPVVSDRMRLWAIGILTAACMSAYSYISLAVFGIDVNQVAEGPAILGVLGVSAACCLWLAFLPPGAYRRRVAARAHS